MTPSLLRQIPEKLKTFNQFVMWKYEKKEGSEKLTKVPYSPATGRRVSPTESTDYAPWVSFDYVLSVLEEHPEWYAGAGFILTQYDPFCIIDLDDTEEDQDLYHKHLEIYKAFGTYAEISPGGKGAHLVLEGSVPSGRNCRKKRIEMYSDARFITMTGNLVNGLYMEPSCLHQELISSLYEEIGEGRNNPKFTSNFDGGKETYTDDQIIQFCAMDSKFVALFQGQWQDKFESQSEADMSLLSRIVIYTESSEQLQRIFLRSILAHTLDRKPDPDDYLHRSITKAFSKKLPTPDFTGLQSIFTATPQTFMVHDFKTPKEAPKIELEHNCFDDSFIPHTSDRPTLPPGYMGELVQYIYNQMPRQVAEYAVAAGLALMSGILGRYLNITGVGLNQYFVIVGTTGSGKEGSVKGISNIINAVVPHLATAREFLGASSYTGQEALIKTLSATPSIVATFGEISELLSRLLSKQAKPSDIAFKGLLLDLYSKSGRSNVFNGAVYASREKSIPRIAGPAFSFFGDTVPESFYKLIDELHTFSGLFPRFSIVEYHGTVPYLNEGNEFILPSANLVNYIASMCDYSLKRNQADAFLDIKIEESAQIILRDFQKECTDRVNCEKTNIFKELWNRAHIKALKTAGVLAGTESYHSPQVSLEMAEWSINFVTNCIQNLMHRADKKTLGFSYRSNEAQYDDLMTIVRMWTYSKWFDLKKYKLGSEAMHTQNIIPHSFFMKMLNNRASFKEDRFGTYAGIRRIVQNAIEAGDLRRLQFHETALRGIHGDAYLITCPAIVGS